MWCSALGSRGLSLANLDSPSGVRSLSQYLQRPHPEPLDSPGEEQAQGRGLGFPSSQRGAVAALALAEGPRWRHFPLPCRQRAAESGPAEAGSPPEPSLSPRAPCEGRKLGPKME